MRRPPLLDLRRPAFRRGLRALLARSLGLVVRGHERRVQLPHPLVPPSAQLPSRRRQPRPHAVERRPPQPQLLRPLGPRGQGVLPPLLGPLRRPLGPGVRQLPPRLELRRQRGPPARVGRPHRLPRPLPLALLAPLAVDDVRAHPALGLGRPVERHHAELGRPRARLVPRASRDGGLAVGLPALRRERPVVHPRPRPRRRQGLVHRRRPVRPPRPQQLRGVPVPRLLAEAPRGQGPHRQHHVDVVLRLAALPRPRPVMGHVRDHPPPDEGAAHEPHRQPPLRLRVELARQSQLHLARQLRVPPPLRRLDRVPQPLALPHPVRRIGRGQHLRARHVPLAPVVMHLPGPLVPQRPPCPVRCRRHRRPAVLAPDHLRAEPVDRHAPAP